MSGNYFSHDSNARNSDKILAVRMEYGMEGYGIYFALLERLREEDGYRSETNYNVLAYELRVDVETLRGVIEDFNLFKIDEDGYFYSESFLRRMEIKDEKKQKRKEAGKKGGNAKANSSIAKAMLKQCQSNALAKPSKEKERKGKESKEKKSKVNTPERCNALPTERREVGFTFKNVAITSLDCDDKALLETLKDFEAHRKLNKKPLTERAVKILCTKLKDLSKGDIPTMIQILEQSIMNGWTGIFEIKGGGVNGQNLLGRADSEAKTDEPGKFEHLYANTDV